MNKFFSFKGLFRPSQQGGDVDGVYGDPDRDKYRDRERAAVPIRKTIHLFFYLNETSCMFTSPPVT
jgi:hypothetical protein